MDKLTVFPDKSISNAGPISAKFLSLGINGFIDACRYIHVLPYGYNTDRDDPMVHCFLVYGEYRVDLSEGNNNGKNRSIEDFLFTQQVEPNISAKAEYLLYRKALKDHILMQKEMAGVDITQILHAREEGLELLKHNINQP